MEVEDSISTAQSELARMEVSVGAEGKEILDKVTENLVEGALVLKTWQKHIKVGDHSDFGWGAIHHYQTDPLTDNSNDEKELRKADKVARWDYEKREAYFKRPQEGRIWNGRRGRRYKPYSVGRSYHQYHDSWDTPWAQCTEKYNNNPKTTHVLNTS